MNLNLLNSFVRVVDRQSLSAAARDLFLTQPAVSKQIQTLEELFGAQLLERVGHRVRPTETGEVLYRYAREILRLTEEMEDALSRSTSEVQGRLVIGASTVPGSYLLPSLIGRYKQEYPQVRVTMEIGDTDKVIGHLLEQRFDLAVVGAMVKHRKLVCSFFREDQLRLIVSSGHPLAGRKSVSTREMLKEKLVWREKGSGTRTVVENRLLEKGHSLKELDIVLELGSTEAIISAVEEGLGAALVSSLASAKSEALGRVASLDLEDMDMKRPLYLVYPRQKHYSRAVASFLELFDSSPVKA
ncbi:MAG: LysR family transcriptional regulator [Firmicutes bacterium]|nr:LysR family transcriptional regulator [Bacillota bacterium]